MLKVSLRKEKLCQAEKLLTVSNIKGLTHPLENHEIHDYGLTLDAALLIAQTLHVALRAEDGKLVMWHPGVVVPRDVARVIRTNQREVLRLIGLSHVSVCPSPELHYHSWQFVVKRDCCTTCAKLNYYIDGKKEVA